MRTSIYMILLLCVIGKNSWSQIIAANATATQMANTIVGPNMSVSNATLTSASGAYGTFTNANTTNLGLTSGAVLTTGKIIQISGFSSYTSSWANSTGGDATLTGITGQPTYDACILEFDVTPICSPFKIKFVFASEEYPEYVNHYNDGFGIFVTGQNPNSWNYTNYNMARLPNPTVPITINNVNQTTNSSYYIDNQVGSSIVYDGFTGPIVASLNIVPCTVYHIKIAIADAKDEYFDSGVFLQKENSSCTPASLSVSPSVFVCPGDSVFLTANGAENYTWSPASGLNTTTGAIVIATPSVTTTYTVFGFMGCDSIDGITSSVTVDISGPNVIITPNNPTITIGDSITLTASGGIDYVWLNDSTTSPGITVSPNETTTYTVVATGRSKDWECVDTAMVTVDIYDGIYVPNAFTPNGDGLNDVFLPEGGTLETDPNNYELLIFNRWGNLIFKTSDPNIGWDGNNAGVDVYVWKITTSNGKYKIGHVSLIR